MRQGRGRECTTGVLRKGVEWQRRKHRGGNRGVFCETGSCRDQGPLSGYSSEAEGSLGCEEDEGMKLSFAEEGQGGDPRCGLASEPDRLK